MTKDTNQENALRVIRYIQSNTGGKELNHLLLAMNKTPLKLDDKQGNFEYLIGDNILLKRTTHKLRGSATGGYNLGDAMMWKVSDYDLTKTVEENLESNPKLTNYLLDLFQLTTNN